MLSDKLVDDLKVLLDQDDESNWKKGDLVLSAHPALTNSDISKLADVLQTDADTIKQWRDVAREFSANRRDKRHRWGVYKILKSIPEPDRWNILDARSEWTTTAMRDEVRRWHRAHPKKGRTPSGRVGMNISGYRFTGEMVNDNIIRIEGEVANVVEDNIRVIVVGPRVEIFIPISDV